MPLTGPSLPELHGARVRLRTLRESDLEDLFAIFSDFEVTKYTTIDQLTDLEHARAFLDGIHGEAVAGRLFQWGVAVEPEDRVVGTCTLFDWDRTHLRAGIGFALGRPWWGRGIGTDAASALVRFAFEDLELHRLEADADPRNAASRRILTRLGFREEGRLRERYLVAGEAQDAVLYGLLRSEWAPE